MGTFRRSVELVKSSWSVLRHDRELIWLPVISAVATVLMAAPFALGAAAAFATQPAATPAAPDTSAGGTSTVVGVVL
ncbi:MAG: hypothetical protein ACKOYM_10130, partial [Actinomycetes bacterium]